jgi:hypothetical protein
MTKVEEKKEEFKPIPNGAIYVFGSNESGIHGSGTARTAREDYGAIMGNGWGLQGKSFAIPTKDWDINTLTYGAVEFYVERFIAFALSRPKMTFYVTKIGCGLAGLNEEIIKRMFIGAPENCILPYGWEPPESKGYTHGPARPPAGRAMTK